MPFAIVSCWHFRVYHLQGLFLFNKTTCLGSWSLGTYTGPVSEHGNSKPVCAVLHGHSIVPWESLQKV